MHITRKITLSLLVAAAASVFTSCVDPKEVVYLQDAKLGVTEDQLQNYQTTIQKNDQLYITVSSKQPELVEPFRISEIGNSGTSSSNSSGKYNGYLVDANGDIVLPIIGKIHAAGKTCSALGNEIAGKLRNDDYIRDAAVNVRITNFKFSVLGEISSPGTYTIDGERITILEAISMAGDLAITGQRDVTIIRERNGKREINKVDLRSADIFKSPYYYLQQNDVIVVRPGDTTINTSSESFQMLTRGAAILGFVGAIVALCI